MSTLSPPIAYPHSLAAAKKTVTAGEISLRDATLQDLYRVVPSDRDSVTDSTYSIGVDDSVLEATRETRQVLDGQGRIDWGVLRTSGTDQYVDTVLKAESTGITVSSRDGTKEVNVVMDTKGLVWDDSKAAIYLGGKQFRIIYLDDQPYPTLSIQGLRQGTDGSNDTDYLDKLILNNDV